MTSELLGLLFDFLLPLDPLGLSKAFEEVLLRAAEASLALRYGCPPPLRPIGFLFTQPNPEREKGP